MQKSSEYTKVGKKGEQFVCDWLRKQGYRIITQNYRWRGGEIDIIAQKKEVIAFVEVKRRFRRYFALSSVITLPKQQKIMLTAQKFLIEQRFSSYAYRFDIALVEGIEGSETITYIEQAFRDERFSW